MPVAKDVHLIFVYRSGSFFAFSKKTYSEGSEVAWTLYSVSVCTLDSRSVASEPTFDASLLLSL